MSWREEDDEHYMAGSTGAPLHSEKYHRGRIDDIGQFNGYEGVLMHILCH
jgi:hypothetical protein